MEGSHETSGRTATSGVRTSSSPSISPSRISPPDAQSQQVVIISPCAACKILRRRCVEKCVLAPYFPPHDPLKFTTAHRVFGASNIIKFLQELPEEQRGDAVSSMVYEANARLREPVYGCAGAICQLQKQVNDLQEQLAKAQAQLVNLQCQNTNLMALICMEMSQSSPTISQDDQHSFEHNMSFMDDTNLGFLCEQSLWA